MQKSLFGPKLVPASPRRKKRTVPKPKPKIDEQVVELMNRRERQVLVHSCIYYYFNDSIIADGQYDKWSHELYSLIVAHPEEFRQTVLYKEFKQFDGNTGMGLPYDCQFAVRVAERLLRK